MSEDTYLDLPYELLRMYIETHRVAPDEVVVDSDRFIEWINEQSNGVKMRKPISQRKPNSSTKKLKQLVLLSISTLLLPTTLIHAATLALVPANKVCMVDNTYSLTSERKAAEVDGKTYYISKDLCSWNCRRQFESESETNRFSKDPVTNETIDKADAVIASNLEGKVSYFQSIENFKKLSNRFLSSDLREDTELKPDYIHPYNGAANHEKSPQFVYCEEDECPKPTELKAVPRVTLSIKVPQQQINIPTAQRPTEKEKAEPQKDNSVNNVRNEEKREEAQQPETSVTEKTEINEIKETKETEAAPVNSKTAVYFILRSNKITREAAQILDELPTDRKYILTGYTCPLGTTESNKKLATARVKAVERYLERQGKRVIAINGKGKCCYVKDDKQQISYEKSRRVEITSRPL